MSREPARHTRPSRLKVLTFAAGPPEWGKRSSGWRRAIGYLLAAAAPSALTAVLMLRPDSWPKPYSWQYLGISMIAALAGGTGAGLIAFTIATLAVWWLQIPSPVHPGVEMFAVVGLSLLAIIDRFKRTQRELRERAAVLHSVLEAMADAVYVGTRDGIVLCNTRARRMLGAQSLEDLQTRIEELEDKFAIRWPESGQRLKDEELPFTRALRGETVVEEVLATSAETERDIFIRSACAPIVDDDTVVGAVAINSDITDSKKAEEALRQSEQRFRTTLDEMLEGCAIIGRDWTLAYVNDTYATHARLKRDEMVGHDLRQLLPGVERSVFFAAFRRCMDDRVPESVEAEYTFADGARGWFEARVRPVPEGIFVLTLDVTKRKVAEQALEAARHSAERARAAAEEANQAKDHFLAVLSHELRTPLTPVLAGIALLKRDTSLSGRAKDYIEVLRRNVEVESHLIDDLLDVTRITHGKVQLTRHPVELRPILERAVEVCRADIEARKVHFGVDYRIDDPCFIDADGARLQQVFWNLLKNAIKFTPKGGCVGIRCVAEAGDVVVEVNDSGIGIAPDDLARIFDAFAQGEQSMSRQFGGLGLGLTISRALVEKHGGTLTAHSDGPGRGATFAVRLPVLPLTVPPEPLSPPDQRRTERAPRPLRVLLVEDHGDTAQMMAAMLERGGHQVETWGDVATALDAAARASFDLLVSDLGLPDRSGIDLIRELRTRGHKMPAIAVSGYGHEQAVRQSLAAGFSSHLVKPVDLARLLQAIDAAVAWPKR